MLKTYAKKYSLLQCYHNTYSKKITKKKGQWEMQILDG